MNPKSDGSITQLLELIRDGDASATSDLLGSVYEELRQVAAGLMRDERRDHTLQPTALVHEAVLRLFGPDMLGTLENRAHFFGAVARAMRQILIEHARRRGAARHGGTFKRLPLDEVLDRFEMQYLDLFGLHEALEELGALDARQKHVVELRFFWGFTVEEVAKELGVSVATVEAIFRRARAYLRSRLAPSSLNRAAGADDG